MGTTVGGSEEGGEHSGSENESAEPTVSQEEDDGVNGEVPPASQDTHPP